MSAYHVTCQSWQMRLGRASSSSFDPFSFSYLFRLDINIADSQSSFMYLSQCPSVVAERRIPVEKVAFPPLVFVCASHLRTLFFSSPFFSPSLSSRHISCLSHADASYRAGGATVPFIMFLFSPSSLPRTLGSLHLCSCRFHHPARLHCCTHRACDSSSESCLPGSLSWMVRLKHLRANHVGLALKVTCRGDGRSGPC